MVTTMTMQHFETRVQEVLKKSVLQLKVAPCVYSPPFECVDALVEQLFDDDGVKLKERACRRMDWSPAQSQTVFEEYKKFLTLKAAAGDWDGQLLSPPPLIDKMWRLHVLETHQYTAACLSSFGRIIEHDPDGDLDRSRQLVRRFAAAAAVRARFADGFEANIWSFGPLGVDDKQPLEGTQHSDTSTDEPPSKRCRRDDFPESKPTVRIEHGTSQQLLAPPRRLLSTTCKRAARTIPASLSPAAPFSATDSASSEARCPSRCE